MSERGVFAVDRGIWDHPLLDESEPFSKREAWLWMVGAAAWKPTKVRVGRSLVAVSRGQLAFSERFLANKFKWSKSRVHRFLDALKTEAMVSLKSDHETNLITICNYDDYQFGRTNNEPQIGPRNEPLADQPRTKEEELNKRNAAPNGAQSVSRETALPLESPLTTNTDSAEPKQTTEEASLFRRAKEVLGANAGGMVVRLLKAKKGNVPLARAAIELAATKHAPREYIGAVIAGGVASIDGKRMTADEAYWGGKTPGII